MPSPISIFVTGLIYTGLSYASIPLIEAIYGQNMIIVVATIFGLGDYQYLYYVVPSFIFVIGLIQATVTYGLIVSQLPKIGMEKEERDIPYLYEGIGLLGSLLSLLAYFIFKEFCLFFLIFAVFFGIYETTKAGFFALLYQYPAKPLNLVLLNILFDMFLIIGLVYNILSKRKMSIE